jgi:hypothetical protein
MFKFADRNDVILMIIGTIASLGAGCIRPVFSYIFGSLTLVYGSSDPIGGSLTLAIDFWILGVAAWILSIY